MIGGYRTAILASFFAAAVIHAQTPADQRGIFVYSEHLQVDQAALLQSLNVSGVDGMTLLQDWNVLETDMGVYKWAAMDQLLAAAVSAGKKITLAVRAGGNTPCWLFQSPACGTGYNRPYAGAAALPFQVSARQGIGQSSC